MSDLLGQPLSDTDSSNPFTPDFGVSPHLMVGRSAQMAELRAGLGRGPRDPRFTSVIIGHRGAGKTVLLSEVEDMAMQAGWAVLKTDATTSGIYDRLEEAISTSSVGDAVRAHAPGRRRETEWTIHAGLASVSRRTLPALPDSWSLKRKIESLGQQAADSGSAVLLSIDELQAGDREELRRLSADLQHVTKRSELPVAFVGAGLPAIEYTVMRDPKMTFFPRCHDLQLRPLDAASVLEFYNQTIRSAGGECSAETMLLMADASRGLPYKMQVIGDYAWRISGAPAHPIDMRAAELAIHEAERRMTTRVYAHIWDSLHETDRGILKEVAKSGGSMPRRALGQAVPLKPSDLANRLRRLETIGCVARERTQDVALGVLTPAGFITDIIEDEASVAPQTDDAGTPPQSGASNGAEAERSGAGTPPKCNKLLPTINATCILKADHKGRCRSR